MIFLSVAFIFQWLFSFFFFVLTYQTLWRATKFKDMKALLTWIFWSHCDFLKEEETWITSTDKCSHRFCLKHVFLTLISLIKNVRLGSTVVEIELKIELQCLWYMQNNRVPMGKLNKLKLNWALLLLVRSHNIFGKVGLTLQLFLCIS